MKKDPARAPGGKTENTGADWKGEDAYWKEHYATRPYVDTDASYDQYRPAYQIGCEGFLKHRGKRFEEVESDLAREYEKLKGKARLSWERAKQAVSDAWHRLEKA